MKFSNVATVDQALVSLFHLGLSIHHLNQKTEKKLGLSLGQWVLLKHLIEMPATSAHTLAAAVGVHPSTLTQSMKRLEDRGLLFITEDPRDSRTKLIAITRKGKVALDQADATLKTNLKRFSKLNPDLVVLRNQVAAQVALI